jgi:WD40 repeat protein
LNSFYEIKFCFVFYFLGRNKHASAVTWVQVVLNYVVSSGDDGTVKLWDLETGDFIRNLVTLESNGNGGKEIYDCMIEKKQLFFMLTYRLLK